MRNKRDNMQGRFDALIESNSNPFRRGHSENRVESISQVRVEPVSVETSDAGNVDAPADAERPYIPVSARRRANHQSRSHDTQRQRVPAFRARTPAASPVVGPSIASEELFPSTLPTSAVQPSGVWKRSGVDVICSTTSEKQAEKFDVNIRPGWARLSKNGIVYGPQSENHDQVVACRKRTALLGHLEMARRHRQYVLDDLELYGDEYYYLFGDPSELLGTNDWGDEQFDDDHSTSSYDGSSVDGMEYMDD